MLEIPEAINIAHQLNETIQGKIISHVTVNASPHKFAFFYKDPTQYPSLLIGKTIGKAQGIGALVEVTIEDLRMTFGDGTNLRFYPDIEKAPAKHQFMLEFTDGSALVVTIQMYGFISVFKAGENDNPYYLGAMMKPSPLSDQFSWATFMELLDQSPDKLSVKAFLATEQRIPGLGNGVLQDILFQAKLHPRRKLSSLTQEEVKTLFDSLKQTLKSMTDQGGRDLEKDLYGRPGGYMTLMSNPHLNDPCPKCRTLIVKEAYLGGNVYYCPTCQPKV